MKIRRARRMTPSPHQAVCDDQAPTCAEQHPTLIGVAGRMLTSWPDTARFLLVLAVLAALVGGLLWLVPLDLVLGPIKISRV